MEWLHRPVTHNISNNSGISEDITWDVPVSLLTDTGDDNEGLVDFIFNGGSNNTTIEDNESNLPKFDNISGNESNIVKPSFELFDFEDSLSVNWDLPIIKDNANSVLEIPFEPHGALLRETSTIIYNESDISENDDLRLANFESEIENMPTENGPINKITSPVKQELNLKIQIERLKRGESELFVIPEPSKTYELREDEVKKRNIRLQQNRKSANKSRLKEQSRLQEIQKKLDSAMVNHRELQKELEQLKVERTRLRHELDKHSRTCATLQRAAHMYHIWR